MELLSTRALKFNEAYTEHCTKCTVYASLNLSALVDKSSIYYCEYCTMHTIQCTLYSVHCTILTIQNGTLIDPRTEIQWSAYHLEIPFIFVSTIEVLCFNYRQHCTVYSVQCLIMCIAQCTLYHYRSYSRYG